VVISHDNIQITTPLIPLGDIHPIHASETPSLGIKFPFPNSIRADIGFKVTVLVLGTSPPSVVAHVR